MMVEVANRLKHRPTNLLPRLMILCSICGPQPAVSFYPGKLSKCKGCYRAAQREYNRAYRERWM